MNEDLALSIGIGSVIVYVIIAIFFYVLLIIAEWKILTKAGEAGWKSLIPFLNLYVIFKIVYGKGIKFLLLLVPILDIVVAIMFPFRLAKVFGKSSGFGVGLLLLPNIFTLVLAFGSAEYDAPVDSFI